MFFVLPVASRLGRILTGSHCTTHLQNQLPDPNLTKTGILYSKSMSNSPTLERNYITFLKIVPYMLTDHRANSFLITFYQLTASNFLIMQPVPDSK